MRGRGAPAAPKPYWRKQVQISMHNDDIDMLDEIAAFHAERKRSIWVFSGKPNRSGTICELIRAEYKRVTEERAAEAVEQKGTKGTKGGRK